ncbi:hypothetical protein GWI33_007269 [Rhynchophorus ferrugineus]|uniref:Laminin G domain-containing protein n=1 Tax=Rhynchophorus ferrugineus TaxID=354439 RepID=A0A834IEH4_RHYFE|nr:hypothetical protein GWI33_007269 [Rhynchophorus ferrugineus]
MDITNVSEQNVTASQNSSVIPKEKRGPKLTFQETGSENTFMFAQSNTFIQIDGDIIQTFQLRLCRQISFQFRTRLPHGLLVYHNVKVPNGIQLQPYALYIIVQQGQLKVVHVYGKHSTALTVGRSLNNDQWHTVTVSHDSVSHVPNTGIVIILQELRRNKKNLSIVCHLT